jgi:hypothetical protein
MPGGSPLSIVELADPNNDVSASFSHSVDPNDAGDPTGATLKATESGPVLTDVSWDHVTSAPGWADVLPFELHLCTLGGDANNSGRVTTANYRVVKSPSWQLASTKTVNHSIRDPKGAGSGVGR